MASIRLRHTKSGAERWVVVFQKRYPKKENFSTTWLTEKEALDFIKKWEKVFFLEGSHKIKYDKRKEYYRRKTAEM